MSYHFAICRLNFLYGDKLAFFRFFFEGVYKYLFFFEGVYKYLFFFG